MLFEYANTVKPRLLAAEVEKKQRREKTAGGAEKAVSAVLHLCHRPPKSKSFLLTLPAPPACKLSYSVAFEA